MNFIFNEDPDGFTNLVLCSFHFTVDSFTNKAQFDAGFSERLKLKDDTVTTRGAAMDSGPPGQHIHSGPPAFRGGIYTIEIAIAFPSQSFFPPSPKSDYTVSAIRIYFVLFFYKVNLEKRLEHFFCSLNTFFLS